MALRAILFQQVAEQALPLAEGGIPQIVAELLTSAAQGGRLPVLQVMGQLRQDRQCQELDDGFGRLEEAFELVRVIIQTGQELFVGVGDGKGILLPDEPSQLSLHAGLLPRRYVRRSPSARSAAPTTPRPYPMGSYALVS
jgi:hypothetical protein